MAVEAIDETAPAPRPTLTFLDVPPETQQDIISHCARSDLICIALVSKHFHELASTQLYRSFNILFPDGDDLMFDSPIDGLAGGLDTFTTSEYNYAKHLKELSMDTVSTGIKAEQAYKAYLYNTSCGKFLNTLLALALRKAKSLETFRWNIRVEISRPVYQELHKIQTLSTVYIRMQSGDSYYTTPPRLPLTHEEPPPLTHWSDSLPFPTPATSGPSTSNLPTSKTSCKIGKCACHLREPPTLSGFKRLKTLSVLDIDTLEVVTELKTCIRNSTSTLKELQISISDSLALQARNTVTGDSDPDDSDVDDDFQVGPASPGSNVESSTLKAFRSQEERKLQESILGRIFDVEPFIVKKPPFQQSHRVDPAGNANVGKLENDNAGNPREEFVTSLKGVSAKLMSLNNGSRDFSATQQDILDVIEKAARKYVESGDLPDKASGEGPSSNKCSEVKKENSESHGIKSQPSGSKEFSTPLTTASQCKGKDVGSGMSPDDIEIEYPDLVNNDDESDDGSDDESDNETTGSSDEKPREINTSTDHLGTAESSSAVNSHLGIDSVVTNLTAQLHNSEVISNRLGLFHARVNILGKKLKDMRAARINVSPNRLDEAESQMQELREAVAGAQRQIKMAEAEMKDVTRQTQSHPEATDFENNQRSMDGYIRDTRGLALETLSVHLIPVKSSVLSRAMDLRCLKNLTLLNVGNQAPIWTMLAKENKTHPLALRNVFTDNVSVAFLSCMSQLDELDELFMLERGSKHKPESFAPKSTTTIDQIRRLVLKKHMPTLKRLMIKGESNGSNWDMNQKAMILICTAGARLEELAVSMNIHAVHAFMQYFSGLISLKAINILHFRNSNTYIWSMRETLNFIVDNLSHHPELKLEWIAIEDDQLDRVIRPSQTAKKNEESPKSRNKGKGKATATSTNHNSDEFPMLAMSDWGSESESDENEEDAFNSGKRLRLKTMDGLQFYEVWGIKIFEKEIRGGRL